MALMNFSFESKYLRCQHSVSIIMPDKPRWMNPETFYTNGKKYKVLWLLHGTFGDQTDWSRFSRVELYACEKDCIVVMPNAINTNYSNWPGFGAGYYQYSYIVKELMPLVHNWFPASSKREDNFIAGLSMGSRGALKIALENPDKFGAVAALSAFPEDIASKRDYLEEIFSRNKQALEEESEDFADPFLPAFRENRIYNGILSEGGTVERYIQANNQWDLVKSFDGRADCPAMYCVCGTKDVFYPEYLNFKAMAEKLDLPIEFAEEPGYEHDWRFWDLYIEKAFDFFGLPGRPAGRDAKPSV